MNGILNALLMFLPLMLVSPVASMAQSASSGQEEAAGFLTMLYILVGIVVLLFLILIVFVAQLGGLFAKDLQSKKEKIPSILKLFLIFKGDTTALTGEFKGKPMQNHEYDGIHELDNDLPPWWKWLFYISIAFGVVYLLHYHVFQTGESQENEYLASVERAELKYGTQEKIYETSEKDEALLANAAQLYVGNCAACHKANGAGGLGPNLTDKYWLHGGGINDVVKIIENGVPEKGMKSWKQDFSSNEIYHIASYILTLQGTNPADGKDPEGELVE